MNLQESFDFLNFWINKATGAWYSISELENLIDGGQMSYYNDIKPKYATSQLVKEILSPFRSTYPFTSSNTLSGYVVIPDLTYLDLLDVQIQYQQSDRTMYYSVPMVNEDVKSSRLNSQIDPVTITSPIGEITAPRFIRMYPTSGYTGTATYLRRPVKPVFAYTVISERVIVYDPVNSVQLEWRQSEITQVLLKALVSIGINLSSQEVSQFAELKTSENYQTINRL